MALPKGPEKCLFCLKSIGPFERVEHPVPESLGNDDLVLPQGFVCDPCNQYFGVKVERPVLSAAPFSIERVRLGIPTKKRRMPAFKCPPHYSVYPTDYRDTVCVIGSQEVIDAAMSGLPLPIPRKMDEDWLIARFLLKMGLELLSLTAELNPYDSVFDPARRFARAPRIADEWQYALGKYPRQEDLIIDTKERDGETWVTEQLYQYSIGVLSTGEVIFAFLYRDNYFALNLSGSCCEKYIQQFDVLNEFRLKVFTGANSSGR